MDEKKTGMGLLRDATRLCAVPGNAGCGVAYALGKTCGDYDECADCISTSLAIIADRIEREREEAAEEAREVAGRLRGMRGYESRHANFNLIYLACFGCDAPLPTTEREDFAAVRDRLCDLIERGGKRDPEREKAADWVEANGGLDEVSGKLDAYDAIDDERGYLMELRAEVAARLGIGLDGIAPAEAHARMLGELDKRLMPEAEAAWVEANGGLDEMQERIAEDKKKQTYDYWNCTNFWCDECPSKINGKNPRERYAVDNCEDAKTIDLYERLRKIAESGE